MYPKAYTEDEIREMEALERRSPPVEVTVHERRHSTWDILRAHSGVGGQTLSTGGIRVTPFLAENLTTVLACVNAIAGSIATLPLHVFRLDGESKRSVPTHAVARLVRHGPNDYQTWPDFCEWFIRQALLNGNALAEIVRGTNGQVRELKPIPWGWVSVQMLPSGRLLYDVSEAHSIFGGPSRSRRLLDSEVVHLRDHSDDGIVGQSRLRRAAAGVGQALALQNFTASMWANGVNPSGIVKHTKTLSVEALAGLRDEFQQLYAGSANARRIAVLDNGMDFTPLSINAEDAELLASRRFSVEEMARIYQVPPTVIGDLTNSSFTNAETLLRYYAQHTLSGWTRKLEAVLARSLLTDDDLVNHEIALDMSEFLRGDPQTRWQNHKIALETEVLTIDEVRQREGFNPIAATGEA